MVHWLLVNFFGLKSEVAETGVRCQKLLNRSIRDFLE